MKKHDTTPDAPELDDAAAETPAIDPQAYEALQLRADGAERKLREIQETFLAARAELEATRARLERDLERKVELRFADLLTGLLDCADDLDRAIAHGRGIPAAGAVVDGVALARERFGTALAKAGLTRIDPVGGPYDPNVAEAVGVVPVANPADHDTVVQLERAGYSLGGRVIRPARVLVGRLLS